MTPRALYIGIPLSLAIWACAAPAWADCHPIMGLDEHGHVAVVRLEGSCPPEAIARAACGALRCVSVDEAKAAETEAKVSGFNAGTHYHESTTDLPARASGLSGAEKRQ